MRLLICNVVSLYLVDPMLKNHIKLLNSKIFVPRNLNMMNKRGNHLHIYINRYWKYKNIENDRRNHQITSRILKMSNSVEHERKEREKKEQEKNQLFQKCSI